MLTPGLTFNAETHSYALDGKVIPSNTSILKAAGLIDDRFYTEWARDKGTAVHRVTELYDRGTLDEEALDPQLFGYLEAWKLFLSQTGFVVEHIEAAVASRTWGFGTTIDRIGHLLPRAAWPQRRAIVEIKSGELIPAVAVQTAGQAIALGDELMDRYAVRLRWDGKYEMQRHKERIDRDRFLAALVIAKTKREWGLL